jgi:hypothetical protein
MRDYKTEYWEAQEHINELEGDLRGNSKYWILTMLAFAALGAFGVVWIYLLSR